MARLPRLYAPGIVQHVLQRPAHGRLLFTDDEDYRVFINLLAQAVRTHALDLHAYVLLPSQLRLLVTPPDANALSRAMQAIARVYVPHINRKTGRDGALWSRRYRSTLIDADRYLLAAMRHVERLPVVDALVVHPADWRWSSHAHHVGLEQQPFIHDHARYWSLSDAPFERQAAFREWVDGPIDPDLTRRLDDTVETGWMLGEDPSLEAVDRANRRTQPLSRGRPAKGRGESKGQSDTTSPNARLDMSLIKDE